MSGWVVPEPGWDDKYVIRDDGPIPVLLDGDSEIVERLEQEEAAVSYPEGVFSTFLYV